MRTVFRCGEGAPGNNRRPKHRKVVRGDVHPLHLFGMVAAGDVHPGAAKVIGRNLPKNTGLLMPDVELRNVRARKRSLRADIPQLYQLLWVWDT